MGNPINPEIYVDHQGRRVYGYFVNFAIIRKGRGAVPRRGHRAVGKTAHRARVVVGW